MNERIQELWKRAGGHYNRGNQHTWPEYTIDDPKKFAELIIQECAKIADVADENECEWIGGNILTHFGVEE